MSHFQIGIEEFVNAERPAGGIHNKTDKLLKHENIAGRERNDGSGEGCRWAGVTPGRSLSN